MGYYYHTGVNLTVKPEKMTQFKQLIKDVKRRSNNWWKLTLKTRHTYDIYSARRLKKFGNDELRTVLMGNDGAVYLPHGVFWHENRFQAGGTTKRASMDVLARELDKRRHFFELSEGDIVGYQYGEEATSFQVLFVQDGRIVSKNKKGERLYISPWKNRKEGKEAVASWSSSPEYEPLFDYDWDELVGLIPTLKDMDEKCRQWDKPWPRRRKHVSGPRVSVHVTRVLEQGLSYNHQHAKTMLEQEGYFFDVTVKELDFKRKIHCFFHLNYDNSQVKFVSGQNLNRKVRRLRDKNLSRAKRRVMEKQSEAALVPYQITDEMIFRLLSKAGIHADFSRFTITSPKGFDIKQVFWENHG